MTFETTRPGSPLLRAIADAGYTTPPPSRLKPSLPSSKVATSWPARKPAPARRLASPCPCCTASLPAKLLNKRGKIAIRALVLTPTRELAAQVEERVQTYGKYRRSSKEHGDVRRRRHAAADRQAARDGVDILVATPGRLLDHAQQGTLDLSQVQILVLDEADRMLDMGFIHDIKKVLALLPAKSRACSFQRTFSDEIKNLADRLLNQPA